MCVHIRSDVRRTLDHATCVRLAASPVHSHQQTMTEPDHNSTQEATA